MDIVQAIRIALGIAGLDANESTVKAIHDAVGEDSSKIQSAITELKAQKSPENLRGDELVAYLKTLKIDGAVQRMIQSEADKRNVKLQQNIDALTSKVAELEGKKPEDKKIEPKPKEGDQKNEIGDAIAAMLAPFKETLDALKASVEPIIQNNKETAQQRMVQSVLGEMGMDQKIISKIAPLIKADKEEEIRAHGEILKGLQITVKDETPGNTAHSNGNPLMQNVGVVSKSAGSTNAITDQGTVKSVAEERNAERGATSTPRTSMIAGQLTKA